MPRADLTGTRIRARRNLRGLRQSDLAKAVGVSPSYLNLIEHNRRKVSAPLLAAIARTLGVSQDALVEDSDTRLIEDARAAALRSGAALSDLERIDDFTSRFPGWARVLADTQARAEALERAVENLNDRMSHDPYLAEALHEIISAVTKGQWRWSIISMQPTHPRRVLQPHLKKSRLGLPASTTPPQILRRTAANWPHSPNWPVMPRACWPRNGLA